MAVDDKPSRTSPASRGRNVPFVRRRASSTISVWDVDALFRRYNVDGLYFDGYASAWLRQNRQAGFAYTDRDGRQRPVCPIRAAREMMRRTYATVYKHRGTEGTLLVYPSLALVMPVLSFCHAVYEGEYMSWSDVKELMEKHGPLAAMTEDMMRTVLSQRQTGLVMITDGRMIASRTHDVTTARQVMAEFLHHDVQDWGGVNGYSPIFLYPLDRWGIAAPGVEFIGYWDDAPAAGGPADTRISAYVNRKAGKVLLVCSRAGGERGPVEVALNCQRLGLARGPYLAVDAESLVPLAETTAASGLFSLDLAPRGVRLVSLLPHATLAEPVPHGRDGGAGLQPARNAAEALIGRPFSEATDPLTAKRLMADALHRGRTDFGDVNGYRPLFQYALDWWGLADPEVTFLACDSREGIPRQPPGTRISAYVNRRRHTALLVWSNESPYANVSAGKADGTMDWRFPMHGWD